LSQARARVHALLKKTLVEVVVAHLKTEAGAAEAERITGATPSEAEATAAGDAAAARLEAAIFDAHGLGLDDSPPVAYAEQFKTLAFNFKRNVPLTVSFYYELLAPARLARMTSAELLSDAARKQAEDARREAQESVQLDWLLKNRGAVLASAGIAASEGLLQCPKCKKRQVRRASVARACEHRALRVARRASRIARARERLHACDARRARRLTRLLVHFSPLRSAQTTYYQKQTRSADEPMVCAPARAAARRTQRAAHARKVLLARSLLRPPPLSQTTFASCLTDTCLHRWRFC
jgi:DNA-directed RNA polymerase subunit M/transcription elongation factor TFIIS